MNDDKDAGWDGKLRVKLHTGVDENAYNFLNLLNSRVRGRVARQLLQEAVLARMSTKDRTQRRSLRTVRPAPAGGAVQCSAVPKLKEVVNPGADNPGMAAVEVTTEAGASRMQSDGSFGRGRAEVNKTGAGSKETDLHKTSLIQQGFGAEGDALLQSELLTRPIPVKKKTSINLAQMAPDSIL